MQKHVQRVDFILTLPQVIRMISERSTSAIRISMGITETATLEFFAEGVHYNRTEGSIDSTSEIELLCPVPPDCNKIDGCKQKFEELLNDKFSSKMLLNF